MIARGNVNKAISDVAHARLRLPAAASADTAAAWRRQTVQIREAFQSSHRFTPRDTPYPTPTAPFDAARDGVVIVDGDFRIVFANAAARALLAQGDALRRGHDGITAATPADTIALRRLIAGAGGHCALTRSAGRPPLAALAVPLRSEAAGNATILFLTDPDRDRRQRADALQRQFGLTRAESTFLAEIVKGDGLRAAAGRLGVSLATARTHLRHVFDKTGARRQAELVGLAAAGLGARHNNF
jgi:DNA-binding CsgD family transcriptional regulator